MKSVTVSLWGGNTLTRRALAAATPPVATFGGTGVTLMRVSAFGSVKP